MRIQICDMDLLKCHLSTRVQRYIDIFLKILMLYHWLVSQEEFSIKWQHVLEPV
jgi:hypothetical protein